MSTEAPQSLSSQTGNERGEPYGPPPVILPEVSVGGYRFVLTHGMTLERARKIVEGVLPIEYRENASAVV